MTTSTLDALVSDSRLLPAARAVLLLRVCVIAQALRPDVLERYWGDLKALAQHLPKSSRESFEGLKDTLEPPTPASLGGFAREIVEALAAAKRTGSHDTMLAALRDCEHRIKARWWPFGKRPAWDALVRAWIDVDRADGLMHLRRLPRAVQTNLLIRENDRSALDCGEWDAVHEQVPAATRAAVEELLERDDPLDLSAEVAEEVAQALTKAMFEGDVDDHEAESRRDTARDLYAKLIKATVEPSPEVAGRLMERWFQATAETEFYAERWVSRFFALFNVVALWSSYPALEPRLAGYVTSKAPKHVREAVLAHAAGLKPKTADEAEAAWAALESQLTDRAPAEHWFLLTLLRVGLPEHALKMARRSPRAEQIVPCLRRAWLYEHPDSARTAVGPESVAGDEIAGFLLRDRDGRVEFLRERTQSGQSPLPAVMWKPPDLLDIVLETGATGGGPRADRAAVGSWYMKTEPTESQFAVFVRINGYGQHLYENLDPVLLETLVAWDDAHPDEAGQVTGRMWEAMQGEIKSHIRLDLVRNDILQRCQGVLGAHPATVDQFLHWIRKELVEQSVQQQEGDTIYTFQLNERAPFLYALLAAQKVAGVSAQRCDEILKNAIGTYTANDELMTAAAQLYASEKGLAGLEPPAPLKQRSQLEAWQLGVAQTAFKDVLAALAADAGPTPA